MFKDSLITIDNLSNQEIEDILDLGQHIQRDLRAFQNLASGYLMASLFFEPSTRTRGSFESAMKRMGGQTITTADVKSSSIEKGESLADTVRVWSGYTDLIVMRHPWEGAARLASEYAHVPVINAGDGGHEHPTQTLCDLYTLKAEHGTLDGLRVALCGDLKNGRTIHSLTYALLRFGAQIIFIPGEGLELPDHVKHKIAAVYGAPIERVRGDEMDLGSLFDSGVEGRADEAFVNAIYMTPRRPHQLAMYQERAHLKLPPGDKLLALYMTRRQNERAEGNISGAYPRVNAKVMRKRILSKAIVMHPLPRIDELSTDMDSDPRSRYFEQGRNGVPVRMALISLILNRKPWSLKRDEYEKHSLQNPFLVSGVEGLTCENLNCVAQQEPQSCDQEILVYYEPSPWFLCKYCERSVLATHFCYKGRKQYHTVQELRISSLDQLYRMRFFHTKEEAQQGGLVAAVSALPKRMRAIEVTC